MAPQTQRDEYLPPPTERFSLLGVIWKNLLTPWYNFVLTVVSLWLLYAILKPTILWALHARWEVLPANMRILMTGPYPGEFLWRVWATLWLLGFVVGFSWGVWVRRRERVTWVLVAIPILLATVSQGMVRLYWLGVLLTALVGWALGRRLRDRKGGLIGVLLWVFYFPAFVLLIRGFGLPEEGPVWKYRIAVQLALYVAALFVGVWAAKASWPGWIWAALAVVGLMGWAGPWSRTLFIGGVVAWLIWNGARRYAHLEGMKRFTISVGLAYIPALIFIFFAYEPLAQTWLSKVNSNYWGGLLLNLLITVFGIMFSFPLGVLFALGRRSSLPVIRLFSILYIEFIRGVPFITILFMAQVMFPILLPPEMSIDRVVRAILGVVMFAAAYMAENVRGGLQAIPKGQYEAAYALGLTATQTMLLIILPQALRNVIPVLVGQFIGLLKDTTLVTIVGLLDILGVAQSVLSNPDWIGTQREVYLFVALLFWVFSYGMSYASRRLEQALGVGQR